MPMTTTPAETTTTPKEMVHNPNKPGKIEVTPARPGRDYMTIRDKKNVCKMIAELHSDAALKTLQVLPIRDSHEPAMAFQIGFIIGLIREKYKKMMHTYREMLNKEEAFGRPPRTAIWPPHQDKARTLFYMGIYEFIHELETEILSLIDMLDNIPRWIMRLPSSTMRLRPLPKTGFINPDKDKTGPPGGGPPSFGPPGGGRAGGGPPGGGPPGKQKLRRYISSRAEERYKSRLREQYLLRKLGLNDSLHTTKKRFFKGWPVEETWDNLQY